MMVRRAYMIALVAGVLMGSFGAHAARAGTLPVIALPGQPAAPVVIDGLPGTGALGSGAWGLYAPGRVVPEVLAPVYGPVDPVFAPYAPGKSSCHAGRCPRRRPISGHGRANRRTAGRSPTIRPT